MTRCPPSPGSALTGSLLAALILAPAAGTRADRPKLLLASQIEPDKLQGELPHLPAPVKARHAGQSLLGSYKVCVAPDGHVTEVIPIGGIPGADQAIASTLAAWVFRPRPEPACFIKALQFAIEAPAAPLPDFLPTQRYVLANGLQVLLHQDHRQPMVAVLLSYHAGSGAERPGKSGLAHLSEHLFFENSPGRYLYQLAAADVNATTNFDSTDDYLVVPTVNLAGALALQSLHMAQLGDQVRFPDVGNERGIVLNERRERVEMQPFGAAEEIMWHALFPLPHPYHGFVIGTEADIKSATAGDVRDFSRRNYGPANASLVVVGDFKLTVARELIERHFGGLSRGQAPAEATRPPRPVQLSGPVVVEHEEKVAAHALLTVAWHSPRILSAGDAAAELLGLVLAHSRSGRLRRRLAASKQVISVQAEQRSLRWQSVFSISVEAQAGADLHLLLREVDAELDEIRAGGVTEEELRRARSRAQITTLLSADHLLPKARLLQMYQRYRGQADWMREDLARYHVVTTAEIQRLLTEHLRPDRRVVLLAQPEVRR